MSFLVFILGSRNSLILIAVTPASISANTPLESPTKRSLSSQVVVGGLTVGCVAPRRPAAVVR
jgi:hypothetical protein